jgi:nucleoside 2-deoxyribosyltransferase
MNVFVMMPFASTFQNVRAAIRNAAQRAKIHASFVDEISKTGRITDHIIEEIRRADACVVDITNHNPNVLWEMGFAQAIGKEIVLISQDSRYLFFDAYNVKAIIYSTSDILGTLTQPLTVIFESADFLKKFAAPEELVGIKDYENTSLILASRGIAGTVYNFFDVIKAAKSHVLIAAQNHMHLVLNGDAFKEALLGFLFEDKKRRFDVLICDHKEEYAVKTWQYVLGSLRYPGDMKLANEFFDALPKWAEDNGIPGQIRIAKIPFVPISITFVDPESPKGVMIMLPNAYQNVNNLRPAFIMSKKHNDDIFQYYWGQYLQRMSESTVSIK